MSTSSDPMHRRLAAMRAAGTRRPVAPAATHVRDSTPLVTRHAAVPYSPPPVRGSAAGLEQQLVDILLASADGSLTTREAFARKQAALFEAIAAAPMIEVWHLHKRVSVAGPDDQFVKALARLAPDRRANVIAFMADARRREAVRAA